MELLDLKLNSSPGPAHCSPITRIPTPEYPHRIPGVPNRVSPEHPSRSALLQSEPATSRAEKFEVETIERTSGFRLPFSSTGLYEGSGFRGMFWGC